MLPDWGLRLVVLLAVPSAVALLTFAQPLVAVLFHNGAYTDARCRLRKTTAALMGWRGPVGFGGHQGAYAGLLCRARHSHPGA